MIIPLPGGWPRIHYNI